MTSQELREAIQNSIEIYDTDDAGIDAILDAVMKALPDTRIPADAAGAGLHYLNGVDDGVNKVFDLLTNAKSKEAKDA